MNWKNSLVAISVAVAGIGSVSVPIDAEAKRLGGGRASGMQRQMPPRQPDASPAPSPNQNRAGQQNQAAAPAAPGQQPAAQPGRRSWMGPIAGLAAGLGIAALMSHFGMGEALANFMTMALVALLAVVVIGWLMRRLRGGPVQQGPRLAGAGAPYGAGQEVAPAAQAMQRRASDTSAAPASVAAVGAGSSAAGLVGAPGQVPEGFDAEGFQRVAKMIFIRLQAANDAGNIDDLRKFTTPELFASLRVDLQERGAAKNQTDVMQLDAEIQDTAREDGHWIVSVRFHGLIREEEEAGAHPFNELWHIVKPEDGSRDWAIAGITPLDA
ncbi:MAG: Tim44-like domain-containing protein [Aquabacterium sp.]